MNNILYFDTNTTRLAACLRQIDLLSMEAVTSIDEVANDCFKPTELVQLNELASTLELMQSQLEYYFPNADGVVDDGEWADALAALNSSAEYIEDQVPELEISVGTKALADKLQELSLTYIEAIPHMIATRLAARGGPFGAQRANCRCRAEIRRRILLTLI